MKKRIPLIALSVALLLGAFLLIMTRLHSPQEVLSPPNPNGENRKLQQAFERAVGSGTEYKLQYPAEGEYRSAYVLYDIDGDEESEAVVFYSRTADEGSVRVHILDYVDDEWVSLIDTSGYGSRIDSVTFADLNNDGTSEVIFSWSLSGTDSSRTMTVHSVKLDSKPELKTLSNMSYKAMGVYDMDNDGAKEILVLWNETTRKVQHNYAALMKMKGNSLQQVGDEISLDSTASVYDGVYIQESQTPMAFVDALKDDNTMFTEVIWWDAAAQTLRAPFTDNDTHTNVSTLRASAIPVKDIDEDGLIEIPVAYSNTGSSGTSGRTAGDDADEEEPIALNSWSVTGTAEPGVLQTKAYCMIDTTNRYVLQVDASFRDSILFYRNKKTGVITAYSVTENGRGEPLFSLVYSASGKPKSWNSEYTFLSEQGERAVFGTLTSAGTSAGITNETIQNSLVFY
ncbi:MAG: hypothetical protein IJ241_09620 [Clostridia bacterium]|nr:hypothetical protein [Clostridia bacterium]